MVRREWEAGETGASLAKRYDVGLSNLWRRRASEGWVRRPEPDPVPEPSQGWETFGREKLALFDYHLKDARMLAEVLATAMNGGPLKGVPIWHLGFMLQWRAERLGPEVSKADRAYLEPHEWTHQFWNEDGTLVSNVGWMDAMTLKANRAEWREDYGIPDGVIEWFP